MTRIELVTSPLPREWASFAGLRNGFACFALVLCSRDLGARSGLTRFLTVVLEPMTRIELVTSPLPREWASFTGLRNGFACFALVLCSRDLGTRFGLHPFTVVLEPMTRIELVTSPLPRECSTN